MSDIKVFDIANGYAMVDGYQLSNYAVGTDPVTYQKSNDNAKISDNAFGEVNIIKQHNGSGQVVIRLMPDTPSFKWMMNLANTEKIFPIVIDNQGERISGTQAIISKTPNGGLTSNDPVREFTVHVADYNHEAK